MVENAAEAEVELLALSDHDTVDGVDEALAAGALHGVRPAHHRRPAEGLGAGRLPRHRAHEGSSGSNPADPKKLARALMPEFGMSSAEFGCLDSIWSQESGWNVHADNPSLLGLRHPAGAARLQDVLRRPRLGQQRRDPDPLGPGLHPGPLRLGLRRLGLQARPRLVLTGFLTPRRRGSQEESRVCGDPCQRLIGRRTDTERTTPLPELSPKWVLRSRPSVVGWRWYANHPEGRPSGLVASSPPKGER